VSRPERGGAPWVVVLVAIAMAAVSLALALAALLVRDPAGDEAEQARQSALDAARERTTVLTSYDHRSLEEDFAAVLETATGDFEAEYRTTTEQLKATFLQQKAVAQAEVVAAGLESAEVDGEGPDRAVAVVAVDQVISTAGAPARTERNRLRMELVRPGGTWLVERVERL
jgi:Mce-associated membrane protein